MKKLLTKRTLIVVGILALFAAAAVINSAKNRSAKTEKAIEKTDDVQTAAQVDYYTAFRQTRESTRREEMDYLDSVIAQADADEEILREANEQRLALVGCMESELVIESQIKAKGFSDAAVTFRKGSVNIIVDANELTGQQTAQILDIVMRETGEPAENIKISVRR